MKDVSLQLHKAAIYDWNSKNKHLNRSDEKDYKIFVAFEIDSVPESRPFLLSRDFASVRLSSREVESFQQVNAVRYILRLQDPPPYLVEGPLPVTNIREPPQYVNNSKELSRTGVLVRETSSVSCSANLEGLERGEPSQPARESLQPIKFLTSKLSMTRGAEVA
ncbi:hypothetical protein LguiB_027338 [Lonicera macranthoides]